MRAKLQNTSQLKVFGAPAENGYAVGAITGYERIGYRLEDWERMIFGGYASTCLRVRYITAS